MATEGMLRATTNPAFRFVVTIGGKAVAAFTECTLPIIEWEMQEVKEGGLNTYVHMLPGRRKRASLTLKNGVGLSRDLMDWYLKTMDETFSRKQISVKLMSAPKKSTMTWTISECIPTKWTGPQLKSGDNTIAIQTLELACGEIKCEVLREVADKTDWDPKSPLVLAPNKPNKKRVVNANNKSLIPRQTIPPARQRTANPNNPNLIPAAPPAAPRAKNPSNTSLIPPHSVAPDKARVKPSK